MILVRRVTDAELPAVADFYVEVAYDVAWTPDECVLVAEDLGGKIVGAVRLCEESDVLVLRGMFVRAADQRRGIGRRLLAVASAIIGARECFCIPFAHLANFYALAGFRAVGDDVPRFLAERADGYRAHGYDVFVMRRAPGIR